MNKVTLIGRSMEDFTSNGQIIRNDALVMAGKAAGICYMPDDYLSNGIQDPDKALNRAKRNAISGHYSVFEHMHLSFIIETPKIMAMILNSTGLYSTSEKSARYTMMKPNTEIEENLYNKWISIYKYLLYKKYNKNEDVFSDKEIEKLAIENARYLISVFTPTVLEFTVPYNRAILLCGWLDSIADNSELIYINNPEASLDYNLLYKNLAPYCKDLAEKIRSVIGITKDDYILNDHKSMGIELFNDLSLVYKYGIDLYKDTRQYEKLKLDYYGESYVSNYKASFAELAQAQRHRTLRYSITSILSEKLIYDKIYIPTIIKDTEYEDQWENDFKLLLNNNILPQGTMIDICEQGRFEDFIYKCKERCCYRAQEEIRLITSYQLNRFKLDNKLSLVNRKILNEYFLDNNDNITRCRFKGYACKEPCKFIRFSN